MSFDVIVLGLGACGAATVYQLAKRGAKVLGVDRFSPPHPFGSTHGDTRVTRLAIGEGAHYTPLAVRSHAIWREIEAQTGADLLTTNGGLIISGADAAEFHGSPFFANTVAAAEPAVERTGHQRPSHTGGNHSNGRIAKPPTMRA